MDQTNKKITGKIIQVLGAVVDVYFPMEVLPPIGNALKTTNKSIIIEKIFPNTMYDVETLLPSNLIDIKLITTTKAIIKIFLIDVMGLLVILLSILKSFPI